MYDNYIYIYIYTCHVYIIYVYVRIYIVYTQPCTECVDDDSGINDDTDADESSEVCISSVHRYRFKHPTYTTYHNYLELTFEPYT